ncbi:MAG TPA: hypothetical protein VH251_07645, partial [Verrucomicrobiae bacterium]|nr:hypothetical protein [Verrucomicrobiae bacterium]
TPWQEYLPPDSLQLCNFTQLVPAQDGGVTAVAESAAGRQKMVVTFDGHNWSVLPAGLRNFFCAWREPDQTIWAVTANSLFQWDTARTNWVEHEEISAGRISDMAVEPDGAFWLATSDGLFRGSLPLWCRPDAVRELDSPVACMASDGNGWFYFIADNKLHRLRNEIHREYPLPPTSQRPQTGQFLSPLKDGSLLVGIGRAVFQFKPADGSFNAVVTQAQTQPAKPLGLLPDGNVCLCHADDHPAFDEFDGTQLRPLPTPPTVRGNEDTPATLFATRNGNVWIGGGRTVFLCHDGKWEQFGPGNHDTPEAAVGFAEMTNGIIWCATPDELWNFDGKKWSLSQGHFNHINALMEARDGTVWLASNGGLYHFCNGIWVENG